MYKEIIHCMIQKQIQFKVEQLVLKKDFITFLIEEEFYKTFTEEELEHREWNSIPTEETVAVMEKIIRKRAQLCISAAVKSVITKIKSHPSCAVGQFALLGIDLLLDTSGKFWLLEFTKSPAFRMHPEYLSNLHSGILCESADIPLDIELERQKTGTIADPASINAIKHATSWDL